MYAHIAWLNSHLEYYEKKEIFASFSFVSPVLNQHAVFPCQNPLVFLSLAHIFSVFADKTKILRKHSNFVMHVFCSSKKVELDNIHL